MIIYDIKEQGYLAKNNGKKIEVVEDKATGFGTIVYMTTGHKFAAWWPAEKERHFYDSLRELVADFKAWAKENTKRELHDLMILFVNEAAFQKGNYRCNAAYGLSRYKFEMVPSGAIYHPGTDRLYKESGHDRATSALKRKKGLPYVDTGRKVGGGETLRYVVLNYDEAQFELLKSLIKAIDDLSQQIESTLMLDPLMFLDQAVGGVAALLSGEVVDG